MSWLFASGGQSIVASFKSNNKTIDLKIISGLGRRKRDEKNKTIIEIKVMSAWQTENSKANREQQNIRDKNIQFSSIQSLSRVRLFVTP